MKNRGIDGFRSAVYLPYVVCTLFGFEVTDRTVSSNGAFVLHNGSWASAARYDGVSLGKLFKLLMNE